MDVEEPATLALPALCKIIAHEDQGVQAEQGGPERELDEIFE